MLSLLGFGIVISSVLLGYILHHGKLAILFQPTELLIIGGAALGGLMASCSKTLLKNILHETLGVFRGSGVTKEKYIQLLLCMSELCRVHSSNPLLVETHVEKPEDSEIFKRYPMILSDNNILVFITNTILIKLSSNISPYDMEDIMDQDLQTMHEEEKAVPHSLSRLADALPGLGIVAAVLGVVITMGKLSHGKEVIGESVAAALVGTFLGILLCYGIFQPLSTKVEASIDEKGKVFSVAKVGLIALAKGSNPMVCIEFMRRNIPMEYRPTFHELETILKG